MKDTLLEVHDLHVALGNGAHPVRAVDGVDLTIRRGECFALVGESGCGKSMTALALMRLLPPAGHMEAGRVLLDGQELLALPEVAMRALRGRRMAMIFQEPMSALNPVMTVGDQIGEVLTRHFGFSRAARQARVVELLGAVGIPDPARRAGEYPHQLSGGMKQRVMIAIALAGEPDLLVADEPTTALDVTIQAQVLELLRRLQRERGMALLLITHDLGIVAGMADRVAVMYAGQIVEQAPRDAFFAHPQHPYSRKLFESLPERGKRGARLAVIPGRVPPLDQPFAACRFAARCAYAIEDCRAGEPGITNLPEGAEVRCLRAAREDLPPPPAVDAMATAVSAAGAELLAVSDLVLHFPIRAGLLRRVHGAVRAVDGVSLTVRAGQTLALVGESGCGKTTVGKAVLQLLRANTGSVRFDGAELTRLKGAELRRRRRDFQIIFQDPYSSMNPRMTVGDIIEEGMLALGTARDRGARHTRVAELLEHVGLPPEAHARYPHEFSGGQRQRICIARSLAVNPRLIVCDEPTSALDVSVQAQILNLLKSLQDQLGLGYLFITHNLAVVGYLAHEVAVMYLGRIVEQGRVEDVLDTPKHPYTRALLAAVPEPHPDTKREVLHVAGELPSPSAPPAGCHFHPRCPEAMPVCRERYPGESRIGATHTTRCHLY
jgi:peptide/nickel transport system ATP-binding protein